MEYKWEKSTSACIGDNGLKACITKQGQADSTCLCINDPKGVLVVKELSNSWQTAIGILAAIKKRHIHALNVPTSEKEIEMFLDSLADDKWLERRP